MPIFGATSVVHPSSFLRYAISARQLFPAMEGPEYVELLFRTSADLIQLREKDLSLEELRKLAARAVEASRKTVKPMLLSSHWELAMELGCAGVHLTAQQDPVRVLSEVPRQGGFLVGKSVYSLESALEADRAQVDYLLLAPIFNPISKAAVRPPLGLKALAEICDRVSCPVIALGGAELEHATQLAGAGASGLAGISWVAEEIRRLQASQRRE